MNPRTPGEVHPVLTARQGINMVSDHPSDAYREYSQFYDLYVGDKSDDIPFYLEYAREARTPIL